MQDIWYRLKSQGFLKNVLTSFYWDRWLFSPGNSDWLPDSKSGLLHHLGILWFHFSVADSLPCPIPLKMIVAPVKTWIQMTNSFKVRVFIREKTPLSWAICHLYNSQLKEVPVLSRFFPNQKLTDHKLISNVWCQLLQKKQELKKQIQDPSVCLKLR